MSKIRANREQRQANQLGGTDVEKDATEVGTAPKGGGAPGGKRYPLWQRLFFSQVILGKSPAKKIAYLGVMTALCVVSNFFEVKLLDTQFSLTIFTSMLTGILAGPLYGFAAAFLGDALGFLAHPGNIYMPWIGLSVACMAFIAGMIMNLPLNVYLKLAISCVLVLVVCSVAINTTGMYLYYTKVGFSAKALGYINEHFGGKNMYLTYALARMIFMGQLLNNIANYVLLFAVIPVLKAIKPLKLDLN